MQELIKIEKRVIGASETNAVSARELKKELGITKDFSDWIKTQIDRAGLRKDVDYIVVSVNGMSGNAGVPSVKKEYYITTESSKHIAMMSQGAKGKEVRDYFIAVEKEHFSTPTLHVDLAPVLELLAQQNVMMLKQTEMMIKLMDQMDRVQTRVEDVSQIQQNYILIKQENRANFISPSQAETLTSIIESASTHLAKYHRLDVATAKRLMFGKFNSKFNIKKYTYLKTVDFSKAKAYLESMRDKARLETDKSYKDMVDEFIDLFEEVEV